MLRKSIKAFLSVLIVGGSFISLKVPVLAEEIEYERSLAHTVILKEEDGTLIDSIRVECICQLKNGPVIN